MLSVQALTVTYDQQPILSQLTFDVQQEIVAVIGPSGVGKTTLLRAILGLIPTSGTITLNQTPLSTKTHTLALVPQDYGLLPWQTVARNIALAPQIRQHHKLSPAQQEHVTQLVTTLGLTQVAQRFPGQLSGGQQQRVALARAFALTPDLLLLDEAFSALDPVLKQTAHTLFLKQWQQQPVSTLLVTHDLTEALLLSDRLLILRDHHGEMRANPLAGIAKSARRTHPDFYPQLARLEQEVQLTFG